MRQLRNRVTELVTILLLCGSAAAQSGPVLLDPGLRVDTVVSGLVTPTTIAFLGERDFFVLEKSTGQVKRVRNGTAETVLDLSVNNSSERGLLGIALHPRFPSNPGVYLYWTCRSTAVPGDPFLPDEPRCIDANMTGPDSDNILQVPLLGNRVDRFEWNGSTLVYTRNLIMLRAFQNDAAPNPPGQNDQDQPAAGNHDGGILAFGPDGKLYVIIGDVGRRGQLQNLANGPTAAGVPDDQFGGPEPDDAHFTGVILRLNEDGTAPADNPFFAAGAQMGGEIGANVQKIFVYGIRNSFGMAFDPRSGQLWYQENGEDAYDEINRAEPGMNSGWIQITGPSSRVPDFRQIELTSTFPAEPFPNLQQFRWGPERIAATPVEALARLFMLPGAQYREPQFSWRHVLAPAAIGFGRRGLGKYDRDLFVGLSTPRLLGGTLFRFGLAGDRRSLRFEDRRLQDRVADNPTFHDVIESESLVFGFQFGVVTDIKAAREGGLYVVSISDGAVYAIRRQDDEEDELSEGGRAGRLAAFLSGANEVPVAGDPDGNGAAIVTLDRRDNQLCFDLRVFNIEPATAAHIHSGAEGVAGPIVVPLTAPSTGASQGCVDVDRGLLEDIRSRPSAYYVNVHNADFQGGAARGQLRSVRGRGGDDDDD